MTAPTTSLPVTLRLERATRSPGEPVPEAEEEMLRCAGSAIDEAISNGIVVDPPSSTLRREDVIQLEREIAAAAWTEEKLVGESPLKALHQEDGGWGPPIEEADETPRWVLAIDVLDFLSVAMGPDDVLLWDRGAE